MARTLLLMTMLFSTYGCTRTFDAQTFPTKPAHGAGYTTWHLMLAHDRDGNIRSGAESNVIDAVRSGCQIRIAWGGGRADPPRRSIEHVADVKWISVRNGESVNAQIGDFLINLSALGEPVEEHPRRQEYGGTQHVVHWRATLRTDGTFNAVWYKPHSGEFVARRPQNHPMKWFSDCIPDHPEPLYQKAND